jgi:molecular chaperone GrpE
VNEQHAQTVEEERDEARSQIAELEDKWKRALADLDNYRKRSEREAQRRVDESRDVMLREWLEVVDSVDRALLLAEPDSTLALGLLAVREQIETTLERLGVTRVGVPGERFDPERHEAIAVVESEGAPDGTIVEVARSGFATDDRVLRPAQVVVARRKEGED